jgi:hypothetical protein
VQAALDRGIQAQADLARQPEGSPQAAVDQESLRRAVLCLRSLDASGLSTPDSIRFLRGLPPGSL